MSDGSVLVDITRDASLTSSSILIEVTDKGAGVRYAGDGLATRRGFKITADGDILLDGAQVTAATDVDVTGASILIEGDSLSDRRAELNSAFGAANVTALDGDITIIDGRLTGFSGYEPLGVVGAVNITADNGAVHISSTSENVRSDIITFDRDGLETADDIIITARDEVTIDDAVMSSVGNIDIRASEVSITSGFTQSVLYSAGVFQVQALDGNITNIGATLQGGQSDVLSGLTAALTLSATGNVINQSIDADYIAILYGDTGVELLSGGSIINDTSRIVSNGDISLNAAHSVDVSVGYANGADSEGKESSSILAQALMTAGNSQSVDFGVLPLDGALSSISAGTGLNINADTLFVRGGDIAVNSGDMNIVARRIDLESVYSGTYDYTRTCFIFCQSSGSSTINAHGGRLAASGDINLNGAETLTLLGGDIMALGDVSLEIGHINIQAVPIVTAHSRPSGLYNFWTGSSSYITWQDRLGTISATDGTITINSVNETQLDGGQLIAANIVNPAGVRLLSSPGFSSPIGQHHIGFFAQIGLLGSPEGDDEDDDESAG